MKKPVLNLTSLMFAFGLCAQASAIEAPISDAQIQEIKSSCEAEAKEALYPKEIYEECVNDRLQALKGSQQEKEAS